MKKLVFIALTSLFSIVIYHFFKHPESLSGNKANIDSLTKNPAAYTEKALTVDATVMESTSVMNYTKCLIGDNQNHTIWFISNKPYKKGELIEVNAHLYVIFQKDEQQCAVLIDDDFKMIKGILHYLQNVTFQ
ncbi:MAG TPA: hypothetical protein DCO83_03290 [Mucilaginibacter sp.]|jgi:hypothetical protein|nr:hypothetical protein [Mucilaginibacter sp.]